MKQFEKDAHSPFFSLLNFVQILEMEFHQPLNFFVIGFGEFAQQSLTLWTTTIFEQRCLDLKKINICKKLRQFYNELVPSAEWHKMRAPNLIIL